MAKTDPVHSSRDFEETDPKYHTNDRCPHYRELDDNGHLATGTGAHPLCDWCAANAD